MPVNEGLCQRPDERRLELPRDLICDFQAFELATVWFSRNKIKVMTRHGTGLDTRPAIWGEILASLKENIALSIEAGTGTCSSAVLAEIKASLDRNWPT